MLGRCGGDGESGRDLCAVAGLGGDFGVAGRSSAPPTFGGEGGGKGYAEFVLGAAGNPAAELEATAGEAVEHVEAVACRAEPCEGVDAAIVVREEGKPGADIGAGIALVAAAAVVAAGLRVVAARGIGRQWRWERGG